MKPVMRSLDLFCGIGGLTLGLAKAGVSSIGGTDIWDEAATTFEHNLSPLKCLRGDIRTTDIESIERFFKTDRREIDLLVGGPPCQGYSTVGKRDSSDPRNDLWQSFLRLVNDIRPAYVIIENVEGLVVMGKGAVRESIINSFAQAGYQMECRLLRACDYGIPQLRKRVVFLGWLNGLSPVQFPRASSTPWVTVADAIDDLPALKPGESVTDYSQPHRTAYQEARRRGTTTLLNHTAASHSAQLVEILKHIPDGGNRRSIPDHLQPKSGFHNSYARHASNKPAVAITSNMRKPSSARATHPTQHRGLTVREGLRLQSFDDSFEVLGSRTSQYLQVGNAVPPLLGMVLGKQVVAAFASNRPADVKAARSAPPLVPAGREGQLRLIG